MWAPPPLPLPFLPYARGHIVMTTVSQRVATLVFPQLIRGRMCNSDKPETFNQLWTVEEQVHKRLSCLFVCYVMFVECLESSGRGGVANTSTAPNGVQRWRVCAVSLSPCVVKVPASITSVL